MTGGSAHQPPKAGYWAHLGRSPVACVADATTTGSSILQIWRVRWWDSDAHRWGAYAYAVEDYEHSSARPSGRMRILSVFRSFDHAERFARANEKKRRLLGGKRSRCPVPEHIKEMLGVE